jgi:hypothetical protein
LDAPTLREQGVDVVLENWRSLVAPPGISAVDRRRLAAVVEAMVRSQPWHETLVRYQWNDRYLPDDAFAQFMADEEARVQSILAELGTATPGPAAGASTFGRYPIFVLSGLAITVLTFVIRSRRVVIDTPDSVAWRALLWIFLAAVVNVALLERAGFVLASIPLFWLTARAFDARHPVRDAGFAIAMSVVAYVVFARLLRLTLPSGVLGRWL